MVVVVPNDSAYVVERLGRYLRTLPEGLHFIVPVIDRVAFRYSLLEKEQELTEVAIAHDNVPARVRGTFRWQITDAQKAAYGAADINAFVAGAVRTALRQAIAGRTWDDVRDSRREVEAAVEEAVEEPCATVGIRVASVTVNDVERAS